MSNTIRKAPVSNDWIAKRAEEYRVIAKRFRSDCRFAETAIDTALALEELLDRRSGRIVIAVSADVSEAAKRVVEEMTARAAATVPPTDAPELSGSAGAS